MLKGFLKGAEGCKRSPYTQVESTVYLQLSKLCSRNFAAGYVLVVANFHSITMFQLSFFKVNY
jgi:hypothetical protein